MFDEKDLRLIIEKLKKEFFTSKLFQLALKNRETM